MPSFEVIVQHKSGHAATQVRVVLGGTWGMSDPGFTDRHGRVVLQHSAASPTLYVDGRDMGRARPGKNVVTI